MKATDIGRLKVAAEKAQSKPCYCQEIVIEGFRFDIYWQKAMWSSSGEMTFEIVQFFAPGWGHTHHYYPKDIDALVTDVEKAIEDGKKTFFNGGYYDKKY